MNLVDQSVRQIRRLFILVVGGTVLLAGVLMILTPGPAFLVIPAGLAILAIEFAWARRLLKRAMAMANAQKQKVEKAVGMHRHDPAGTGKLPPPPAA